MTPSTDQGVYNKIKRIQLARTRRVISGAKSIASPVAIEASYYRALMGIVRELTNLVSSQLLPVLKQEEPNYIQDAPIDGIIAGIIARIERQAGDLTTTGESISAAMANRTEAFNRNRFVASIQEALGVNISDIVTKEVAEVSLQASVKANVELIKSIPPQYFERIQKAVAQGLQRQDNFFSIRRGILDVGESTATRAKIIARDQVTKLNAALTEQRQQALGITEYVWRSSSDDRVRPKHRANSGKTFAWADAPSTGHPGSDVLCRCVAEPVLGMLTGN